MRDTAGLARARGSRTYGAIGLSALGLVSLATLAYRLLEDWSWVDSFYFSVIAVTTIGFGDLAPSTDASKLFTVFYVIGGISLVSAFLNEWFKRRRHLTPPHVATDRGSDTHEGHDED